MNRNELADFLRRRREALRPGDVGLSAGTRRRTRGLRREEVAGLAHISTDFYARLEQRRGSRPSGQTIAALSRALRLTWDERDHLYELAGHTAPPKTLRTDHASPGLQRVLEGLDAPPTGASPDDAAERFWTYLHGLVSLRIHKPDHRWLHDSHEEVESLVEMFFAPRA